APEAITRLMNSRREYLLSDMPPIPHALLRRGEYSALQRQRFAGRAAREMRAAARSRHPGSRDVRAGAAHRQVDVEGRSGTRRTLHVDLAVMAFDDLAHDRKPEAGAFAIQPEAVAGFEDAAGDRRLHADAVVAHGEPHA